MKTHDELVKMTEQERERYLLIETQKILAEIPAGSVKNRIAGLQWELNQLRKTKYKDDPFGFLIELNTRMFNALRVQQDKFLEIKELVNDKKLDK